MSGPRYGTPTRAEVFEAARAAIAILTTHGLSCCLVGGVGCDLFGNSRTPNVSGNIVSSVYLAKKFQQDVDLVVITTAYSQEALKRLIVAGDSKFFLVPGRTPGATYKVQHASPNLII